MWPGLHAQQRPDKPAVVMASNGATTTYRELNDRSNQLAQLFFDAGLRFGDHVAVLMENRPEYFEVCWAAQRSGLFYTCINWHFTAEEAAYIIDDCAVDGYERYDAVRDRYPATPLDEEVEGTPMLYSSGTTGRPKGIKYLL